MDAIGHLHVAQPDYQFAFAHLHRLPYLLFGIEAPLERVAHQGVVAGEPKQTEKEDREGPGSVCTLTPTRKERHVGVTTCPYLRILAEV